MKSESTASHAFRLMTFLLLALIGCLPAMAQEAKEFPLGPIGGTYRVTAGSSLALVARLTAGEPGITSGLQVNDAIYGAFGQVFTPTGDAHFGVTQELGFAVDRAESGDGVLPLMVLRSGAGGLTVNVNLAAAGAFGVAYPRNSPKFEAMYENAVAALHTLAMNSNGYMAYSGSGYLTGWTGLALLGHPNWNSTTGGKPYRLSINKIRDSIITRLNASIYAPFEPYLLPTAPGQGNGGANPNINYADTGFSNWTLGPMVMFLAEYYAKTSDATVATTLQRGAEMCANSIQWWKQPSLTGVGGYSPGYDEVAGMVAHQGVNGDYVHQGYAGINMCGVHNFNGMAFSRRAGINMSAKPKDGHYFGYTLNQGDTIPAGVAGCLPSSITLPQYGEDPVRGATIIDPFWYDMSVHQKFVMQMNFLVRRSTSYSTPLTGYDGGVGYAPTAGSILESGGRTAGALLGMLMYQQDVGGLDAADLDRMERLKGFITRNYMIHQNAHAFCVGAQIFQAMCTPYLGDREQRFFMDNWRFFFALSRTSTNGIKYFSGRTLIDNYLDWDHCALLNSALPYGIANGRFSLIPGYNTNRTLANFKSPALMWPTLAARTATVNASTQAFQIDVCDGEGNVLAPAAYSAAWSFVSGPATATFSSNSTAATTVTFPSVSATPYRIRLTVTRAGFPTLTEDIDITRADPVTPVAGAITTQPVAQATPPGGNASFTVAVSGTGPLLYQWRLNGVPYWGTSTSPTLQLTNVGMNSAGAYDCVISTPGTVLTSATAPLTISATIVRKTGGLKRESWYGVGGGAISDLTNNANYPLFPSATGMVSAAETGVGSSTNYGQKLSGWVTPPVSGAYKFHLASYETSQLWLSTDSLAANLVKIAEVAGYLTGFRAYSSGGRSVQINLVAGQKYYLEILHKKGGGASDHVSVAWQFPGENVPADGSAPIDGVYLEYDQLQEQLTNHWKFDEASAATCIDSAGAVTATLYNSPARINDGVKNGALSFNGVNQYAKAAAHVSASAYSASLWFRTSQADGGMFAVTAENGDSDRNIYLVGGNIKARIWSEEFIISTGKAYGDGLWHHVVHTYGGATGGQKLYVDGALVASGSKSQSDLVSASSILIGDSTRGTTRYFNGSIDDVRLYYGALSAQDVTALYQGTVPPVTNTAPQITTNTLTVADDSVIGTPIGTITATDANAGQTLTYSMVGGNVGNRFALDAASGLLTVNGALDFSAIPAYLLTVRVTDNGSPAMSTDAIVTVNLTNTNDPPVFLTNPMAMGGLKDVAFSGMLAATDPDAGDTLTYSKVSGPAWLTVAANGALGGIPTQSDVGANSFVVRVTDAGGLTGDAVLNIGVSENTIWTNPAGGSWLVTGNWLSGTIANGSNTTANFSTLNPTADVTVTLDADRTIGNLAFGDTNTGSAAGWTIAGNKLTLASATGTAPVVTVNALGGSKEVTISSVLMGTQGFVKAGTGILNLSGDNNGNGGITGGIVVNSGIFKLSRANGAIRGMLTINSGGEVRQNASWSLGTDAGGAESAYTNTVNVNGGLLNFAVLGGGMSANVNMTGGEIKSVGNGNVEWHTSAAGGSRILTALASGSTALVSSGLYLRMGNSNGGTAIFDVADGGAAIDFKISGVISEQVAGTQYLLKKGAGTMELSAANSFSGSTKVAAGVLKLTNNNALQNSGLDTSGAGTVTMTDATLKLGGLMGGTDLASVITSGYSAMTTLQLNPIASKTLTYSGIIANGAANMTLTKSGSGIQVLSGANTYSGTTSITAGSLIARSASALGTGNVSVAANTGFSYAAAADAQLALGGMLAVTGGSSTVIGGTIGSTTTSARINVAGVATISNAAHKVNVYGIDGISPAAGTNTYTLIHGGAGSSLNPVTAPTLGTVYNASNFTVGALSRTATDLMVDITSATALTTAYWKGTATSGITKVWAASNGSTVGNWTSTAGGSVQSLVPASTTDVFISATSPTAAPTGTTLGANLSIKSLTIQDGVNGLSVNADGYTLTVGTGGIIMSASVPASTIAANVAMAANQTWTNNSANAMTVNGAVSGAHALTKAGGGLLALGGVNTYTGGTQILGGTLQTSVAGALPDAGPVTLANTSGAVLNLNGFNQTIATLSGGGAAGGNIALGAATLTVNQADDSQFAGVISGSGGLLKTGAGSLMLAGANSYSGTTTIGGGALLMNGINTGTGAFSVAAAGTLGGSGRISGPVSNNGTLAPGGGAPGNLTVTSSLTLGADSAIAWQVADWTGIAGTGYDLLTVNSLAITATSTHPVVIRLSEQALVHFTEASSTFTLIQSTGGITGFQPGKFVLDTTGLPGARYGWSIQQTGNRLELKYTYRLNAAPEFASNPILMNGTQGTAITGSITASDPDPEETLTFSKTSGPAWLAIAANGDLSGTPLNEHAGLNVFAVQVMDSRGATATATLNLTIANLNDAPVFTVNPITANNATEDLAYAGSLALIATDIDAGDTLAFSKVSGPAWLVVAPDGTLSGTPADSDVGPNGFIVRVTDAAGLFAETDLGIYVANTNDAPAFTTDPYTAAATEATAFNGAVTATDVDADDTLAYSKVSGPAWLFVASDGSLGGTPGNSDVGANAFVVRVTDAGGLSDDAVLNISVSNNDSIWTNPAGGSWLVPGNWLSGNMANGAGFTANFNTLNPTADVTVTLDANRTIGNLIFGDTDTSSAVGWILVGNSSPSMTLASTTGSVPIVTVNSLGTGKEAAINGLLYGTQGLIKEGAGTLNLNYANNGWNGITGVTVNNGILKLSGANGTIRGTLTINSGGEVRQNASWSLGTDGGQASSAYTNTININGALLNFAVLGGGMVANINMTGGEIKSVGNGNVDWYTAAAGGGRTLTSLASGSTALVSSGLNLRMGNNNGGTGIFDVADGAAAIDFKISGTITEEVGGSQNLLKKGAGTMELSAANSFAGSTKVAAGVLKLTNNNALQNSGLDTSGAGTVTVTGTTPKLGGLMGGTDLASVITSGYSAMTTLQLSPIASKTLTYSGIIANGAANMNLSLVNGGTQILSGANTYSGTTSITAGTLIARSASALGTSNVTVGTNTRLLYAASADAQLALGGTLAITGGTSTTIGGAIGSTTTSARINVAGAATISNAAHKVNVYGIGGISPAAGTSTYTLVHGGAGSSLNPATAPTLGTVYNASNFTVGALSRTATDLMVDVTSATALTTAYWKGSATSGITKVWAASNGGTDGNWASTAGGAVQSLVPASTTDVYISATSPTAAPTATTLGANLSIKSLTIQDVVNGLSVNADGYTLTVGTGGITMIAGVPNSTIGANMALVADQTWTNNSLTSKTLTVSGAVSGAHSLTKTGGGLLALGGVNTYTGGTQILGGTLQTSVAGALPDAGPVTLANTSGAVLNLNGFNQTIATLSGGGAAGGNIALGAATLTVNQADDSQFAGVISGSGGLLKTGAGSLMLAGANSYSGATMIGGGVLLMNGINTGTGAFSVAAAGTLGGSGRISGPVSNNGTLAPGGGAPGNLTVTSSLTLGADSAIAWQVADWTGIAGTGYDLLTVNSLAITATSTHPVVIRLSEQALVHFTEATSTFTLVESAGGITGFQPGKFVLDTTGLPGARYGWSVQQTGNRLELRYAQPANTAPEFTSNPILMSGTQGTAITGSLTAFDPDPGDTLTFSKAPGPVWLTIAANGDLSGLPLNEHVGLNEFTVIVTDSRGATATATLNLTIANLNDAPVFTVNPITGNNATEDLAYAGSLAATATDIDAGDTLAFSKVSGPAWLVVAPDGTLSGTPANSDVGPNGFIVRVTDAAGLFAESNLGIQVIAVNSDANSNGILDVWEIAHFGNADPGSNSASADNDGDGISNLMEYALNTNPLQPNSAPLTYDLESIGLEQHLRMTVPKNPAATNLIYMVQVCGDLALQAWTTADTQVESDTTTQLRVRDAVSISAAQRRFMRLKVTANP